MHGDEHGMMDWWNIPYMGYIMVALLAIFIIIGVFVYKDAERRQMNGALWLILVLIPWIGVISLVVYLIVRANYPVQKTTVQYQPIEQYQHSQKHQKALEILDERYARGDITREDYYLMKKDMEQ